MTKLRRAEGEVDWVDFAADLVDLGVLGVEQGAKRWTSTGGATMVEARW